MINLRNVLSKIKAVTIRITPKFRVETTGVT